MKLALALLALIRRLYCSRIALMHLKLFVTAALLSASLTARAESITYTESLVASGSLGGQNFTNSIVTLTGTADTSSIRDNGNGLYLVPVALDGTIAGLPAFSFQDGADFFVNAGHAAGVSINFFAVSIASATIFISSSGFAGYALDGPLAPVSGRSDGPAFGISFPTSQGAFELTSGGEATFSAAVSSSVTPEPSSLVLLGTGLLGVAGVARKRLA